MGYAADNLTYLGRGMRTYGLRPVLGRARGYWELQWIFRGSARPERSILDVDAPGKPPCLYVSHPDSPHGWTDDGANEADVFVVHFRGVSAELAAQVKPAKTLIVPLVANEARQHATRLDEIAQPADRGRRAVAAETGAAVGRGFAGWCWGAWRRR